MSCSRFWKRLLVVLALRLVTPEKPPKWSWRGRAAYGSVDAIIGSDPAMGASLVQVISDRLPQFGGGRDRRVGSIVPPSPYGPRMPIEIRAEVAAPRRPTNGSKGNATTELS